MFTQAFDSYVVIGDSITCEIDGFRAVAVLHHDADTVPEEDNLQLDAWRKDEWHYFGLEVTVYRDGVPLADSARWGIDGNYPGGTNNYFREVANDLLPGVLDDAKALIVKWALELPI